MVYALISTSIIFSIVPVRVDEVLGKGYVTGILYGFDIDNGVICYRNVTLF